MAWLAAGSTKKARKERKVEAGRQEETRQEEATDVGYIPHRTSHAWKGVGSHQLRRLGHRVMAEGGAISMSKLRSIRYEFIFLFWFASYLRIEFA